ncbi:DoxX family protein [Streptomyces sp. NPDC059861]|uniref:DoxX family protein n=1 Tax=Streptomyces sp. NPDC059861 TaxID=3346974 RepID=UPI003648EA2F
MSSLFLPCLLLTLLTTTATASAAVADLIGHPYPRVQADRLGIPHSWIRPLGTRLAAASLGLLTGLAVPALGTLAAAGPVLCFLAALGAHLRVHDTQLGAWSAYFTLSLATLLLNVAHLTGR